MKNKRGEARKKLELWVSENPDGYLHYSIDNIAEMTGVHWQTVQRNLYEIIADREGILPSDVIEKRAKAGVGVGFPRLKPEVVAEIYRLSDEDMDPRDIAYTLKIGLPAVRKHLKERVT